MFFGPHVCHTLSLLMDDITQSLEECLKFIREFYVKVVELGNSIRNHIIMVKIVRKIPYGENDKVWPPLYGNGKTVQLKADTDYYGFR